MKTLDFADTDTEAKVLAVLAKDQRGNVVDADVSWTVDSDLVDIAANGESCTVTPKGAVGTCKVVATVQRKSDGGVLSATCVVTVHSGEPVALDFTE